MLARITSGRGPESKTFMPPSSRSVATARKGIGRSSKFRTPSAPLTRSAKNSSTFCPARAPLGSCTPLALTPRLKSQVGRIPWSLRRMGQSSRGGSSTKRSSQLAVVRRRSISSGLKPLA